MDDEYSSEETPASAAASNTRWLPSTLTAWVVRSSREGWISHDSEITASAPAKCGRRSSRVTSATAKSAFGKARWGRRRASPTTRSTAGSSASAASTLVPTFPVAPTTTTRNIGPRVPPSVRRQAGHAAWRARGVTEAWTGGPRVHLLQPGGVRVALGRQSDRIRLEQTSKGCPQGRVAAKGPTCFVGQRGPTQDRRSMSLHLIDELPTRSEIP